MNKDMIRKVLIMPVVFILWLLSGCDSVVNNGNRLKAEDVAPGEVAELVFSEYEYDFGKISEGEKVAHIFSFENKGPGNLVIKSASTSCGCTVPKYDRSPIPPGKGGNLEVVFDSGGRSGIQTKTISVRSNSPAEVVILKITAEVISRK
jgi:hypothetical protein